MVGSTYRCLIAMPTAECQRSWWGLNNHLCFVYHILSKLCYSTTLYCSPNDRNKKITINEVKKVISVNFCNNSVNIFSYITPNYTRKFIVMLLFFNPQVYLLDEWDKSVGGKLSSKKWVCSQTMMLDPQRVTLMISITYYMSIVLILVVIQDTH